MTSLIRPKLLLIDDDEAFGQALAQGLHAHFELSQAATVTDGVVACANEKFDVICVDYLLMNDQTGLSFIDRFREENRNTPIIAISGNRCLEMSLGFLKRQVNGFLEKPFTIDEFLSVALPWLKPVYDLQDRTVWSRGQWVSLTKTEFHIFLELVQHEGEQVTREYLTQKVWPEQVVVKHTLDTHLLKIKQKLPEFGQLVEAVYGTGFIYRAAKTKQSSR